MTFPVNEKQSINISPILEETSILRGENNSKNNFFKNIFCAREVNLITYLARVALYIGSGIGIASAIAYIKKDSSHISKYIGFGMISGMTTAVAQTIICGLTFYLCPPAKKYCCCLENDDQSC